MILQLSYLPLCLYLLTVLDGRFGYVSVFPMIYYTMNHDK